MWHPWWEAEVDDASVEVLKANVLFRAVKMPAGRHVVRFAFRPLAGAFEELAEKLGFDDEHAALQPRFRRSPSSLDGPRAAPDLTRMNYRHAYHAGNFADVLKHVVLTLVIEHMKLKPAPFRIIDTHAGIGRYDLAGVEAAKTGEWRDGIGRLMAEEPPEPLRALLAPYLDILRAANGGGGCDVIRAAPRSRERSCDPAIGSSPTSCTPTTPLACSSILRAMRR